MNTEVFKEYFEVRDNEVDVQGIVNNANYMNYLAHARHKFGRKMGLDFIEYAKQGKNLVVLSCTLNFKQPLKPGDTFYVTCRLVPDESAFKFAFEQEIRFSETDRLVLKAHFTATCVNTNPGPHEEKIYVPDSIKQHYTAQSANS